MCHVLEVSRAGYYAWLGRPESPRAAHVRALIEPIRQVHRESDETYGSPRVYRELKAQGLVCCEKTVAKLMRRDGLRAANARRFVVQTTDSRHGHAIAENTLDRQFEPGEPDRVWVADITYIATGEGWVYLAAVLDLGSRKVIGWATADHLRSELAEQALTNALEHRRPTGPVLHHSDRGVQYACDDYQELLQAHGFEVSMSRKGNCHDNAVMESFFGTLKTDPTTTSSLRRRCRGHSGNFGDRVPMGVARSGTLVPGASRPHRRRKRIVFDQSASTPPRA
jgi:putative transposase